MRGLELPDAHGAQVLEVRSLSAIPKRGEFVGVRKLRLFRVSRESDVWAILGRVVSVVSNMESVGILL